MIGKIDTVMNAVRRFRTVGKGCRTMANLVAFLNSFLSYLLLFAICVIVVIAAVKIGITMRRNKDAKDALAASVEETDAQADNNPAG